MVCIQVLKWVSSTKSTGNHLLCFHQMKNTVIAENHIQELSIIIGQTLYQSVIYSSLWSRRRTWFQSLGSFPFVNSSQTISMNLTLLSQLMLKHIPWQISCFSDTLSLLQANKSWKLNSNKAVDSFV